MSANRSVSGTPYTSMKKEKGGQISYCMCLDLVSGKAESLCKEIKSENKAVSATCRSMQKQALTEPGEMLTPCFSLVCSVSSINSNRHCIILNCLVECNADFRLGLSLRATMEQRIFTLILEDFTWRDRANSSQYH